MKKIILLVVFIYSILVLNIHGEELISKKININPKYLTSYFFKSLPYSDQYDITAVDIKNKDTIADFDIELKKFIRIKNLIDDFSKNGYMNRKKISYTGERDVFLKNIEEGKLNMKDREKLFELLDEYELDDYLIFYQWILTCNFEGKDGVMRDLCARRAGGKKFKYTDNTIIAWFKNVMNADAAEYNKEMFTPILYGLFYFVRHDELANVFSNEELSAFSEKLIGMEKNGITDFYRNL